MSAEITEEKDVMSGPEAEEFIEELKKVFSIVRLLDKDNFEHMERHYNEHGEVPCQCYEIWKKKSPCENCISTKTFADGKQRTKLEFIGLQDLSGDFPLYRDRREAVCDGAGEPAG